MNLAALATSVCVMGGRGHRNVPAPTDTTRSKSRLAQPGPGCSRVFMTFGHYSGAVWCASYAESLSKQPGSPAGLWQAPAWGGTLPATCCGGFLPCWPAQTSQPLQRARPSIFARPSPSRFTLNITSSKTFPWPPVKSRAFLFSYLNQWDVGGCLTALIMIILRVAFSTIFLPHRNTGFRDSRALLALSLPGLSPPVSAKP